jgi:hypothetical protein
MAGTAGDGNKRSVASLKESIAYLAQSAQRDQANIAFTAN